MLYFEGAYRDWRPMVVSPRFETRRRKLTFGIDCFNFRTAIKLYTSRAIRIPKHSHNDDMADYDIWVRRSHRNAKSLPVTCSFAL